MHHLTIKYDWETGHIPEEKQQIVEVTSDLIDLVEKQKKAVMITKVGEEIVIYTDSIRWRFKQR